MKQIEDIGTYGIDVLRTRLTSSKELQDFFQEENFSDYYIPVVMRGSGSGLEVFDDSELCEQLIETPTPLVTAIGHEQDVTLLEHIADRGPTTTTAFGSFLKNIYGEFVKRNTQEKAIIKLQENIQELKREKTDIAKNQESLLAFERKEMTRVITTTRNKYYFVISILLFLLCLAIYFLIKS